LIKFGKTIIMTFKVILPVEDNKVVITLPPDFSGRKNVLVYVDDEINQKTLKIEALKSSVSDPLFQEDLREIQKDFDAIDIELV